MTLPQRFFLGLILLPIFSMLMYIMPEDTSQIRFAAWAIMVQVGFVGLILSKSKERKG